MEIAKCAGFIAYASSKISKTGWLVILQEYSRKHDDATGRAVKSWHGNLRKGFAFQDSIMKMNARFPACLESLLIRGYESSTLDYVLHAIYKVFKSHTGSNEIYDALSLLHDEQAIKPKSEYICQGCMMRDLGKIINRAKLEQAGEVVFEQEKDKFFIQRYLGPKAITYREPCHSKTYNTILKYLREWSRNKKKVKIANDFFGIKCFNKRTYILCCGKNKLIFSFQ